MNLTLQDFDELGLDTPDNMQASVLSLPERASMYFNKTNPDILWTKYGYEIFAFMYDYSQLNIGFKIPNSFIALKGFFIDNLRQNKEFKYFILDNLFNLYTMTIISEYVKTEDYKND